MEKVVIRCPYCSAEYLPGEIFLPKHFLGQPKNIEKDYTGKLLDYEGLRQDLKEYYICDKCKSTFTVKASINYKVEREFENKNSITTKTK